MLSPFAAMTASNFSIEFTNFDVLAATYFYFNVNGQAQTPVLLTSPITPINLSVAVPALSKISIGFSSPGAAIGGPVTTDVLVSFQLTQIVLRRGDLQSSFFRTPRVTAPPHNESRCCHLGKKPVYLEEIQFQVSLLKRRH